MARIEIHVESTDDIPAARSAAEKHAKAKDEVVIIVAPAAPVIERQPMVQVKAPGR